MLFGYVFNITIVSALVNVFLSLKLTQIGHYYLGLLIPLAAVVLNHIPDEYRDVPLSKLGLKADTGILVMLVEHPGEKPTPAGADTVFAPGDKLTVFGNYATICKSFHARERFAD